ncbi:hypothetical protein DFP72DRAFT_900845 [Ephemerocybe angulata]|uniref:Uncharacterized protein n=1 Tax=Ephemerocybe angulata TaxID=980116 RepID=A0A8H6HVE4_9AGAR|nr:hypothetical protein DFP72DRAFT_900845 [Tulosesus angulatus]
MANPAALPPTILFPGEMGENGSVTASRLNKSYLYTPLFISLFLSPVNFFIAFGTFFLSALNHRGPPLCETVRRYPTHSFTCDLVELAPLLSVTTFIFGLVALGVVWLWRRRAHLPVGEGNRRAADDVPDPQRNVEDETPPEDHSLEDEETAPLLSSEDSARDSTIPLGRQKVSSQRYRTSIMKILATFLALLWIVAALHAFSNTFLIAVMGVKPWPNSLPGDVRERNQWIWTWSVEGILDFIQIFLLGWVAIGLD